MHETDKGPTAETPTRTYHVTVHSYGEAFQVNWQRTKILALKFVVDWHPHQTPLQGHLDLATFHPPRDAPFILIANSLSSPSRNHVSTSSQQDRPQQPIEATSF